jgi:uncharacterized RDD family membrane protein YckC
MYTIIGGDGREYGPVTAEQVRTWLAAGRANLDTQAKALGTNEWKRLGDFPAFGSSKGAEPPFTSASPADGRKLAGRAARLGAFLLDSMLSVFCLIPLMSSTLTDMATHGTYSFAYADAINLMEDGRLKPAAWALFILVAVQIVMISVRGQSVGKLLFRIRIARLRDERNPGFVHAFLLRSILPGLIEIIPVLGMFFMLVDVCFIFREDRRCLHDLIAGTVVVSGARTPHV